MTCDFCGRSCKVAFKLVESGPTLQSPVVDHIVCFGCVTATGEILMSDMAQRADHEQRVAILRRDKEWGHP